MRTLVLSFVLAIGVHAISIALPIENEMRPEFPTDEIAWALVPDGEGRFHFINIKIDLEPDFFFVSTRVVIFSLFTRSNRNGVVIPLNDANALAASTFNANHPTRFIIHGWNNDGSSTVNTAIRAAYMTRGEFNVIVVDWGAGAQTINYLSARNRVNSVGALVGSYIDFLNIRGGMSFSNLSVIGHSLGAHTAGIAGKSVTRGTIGSIIAMDPALPLFSFDRPKERVHYADADYVEIIHTNAGLLGFDEPVGDASFYPNFGRTQPGCGIDLTGGCAHGRAVDFFAESINSDRGFWARQCRGYEDILNGNCVASGVDRKMGGEPLNSGNRGIFWTRTNNVKPFARGIIF